MLAEAALAARLLVKWFDKWFDALRPRRTPEQIEVTGRATGKTRIVGGPYPTRWWES